MDVSFSNKNSSKRTFFNDERMFEFVFKAYFPRLMAFTKKFISDKSAAEDIIQEAFLKVWIKRDEIEEETFRPYLFTLIKNACLNHIKHQKIVEKHHFDLVDSAKQETLYYADFFSDPFHQTIFNEVQKEIGTVMQNLPEQTRRVFHLSRFKGMKNQEIAKKLNISVRTVEKHNTKALQKLKAHLSKHYLYAIAVLDLIKELNN